MEKIVQLLTKHKGIILYLVFGVLTTVVNYLVYYPCYNPLQMSASVSNAIAWCVAVVFAFVTNKPFVFESKSWALSVVLQEVWRFLTTRIGSGVIETLLLLVCVDMLSWDGNIMKLITSVLVVILNYIGSKFFVFKK